MSDELRNKYCVIGASQSGKTHYIINTLIPSLTHKPNRVILCGHDHNISKYRKSLPTHVDMMYYGHDPDDVIAKLTRLCKLLSAAKRRKETLVVFDDFVDNRAIKNRDFMDFIATCRHQNITIIYATHSVDTVLTPFMKLNMTHFIICQYAPSQNFRTFINTFLSPIIANEIAVDTQKMPSAEELRDEVDEALNLAFSGQYGKLIIAVNERNFWIILPQPKSYDDGEDAALGE
jgi:hypothetical protein